MPINVPSHIFDIDQATADRLIRMAIRKRRLIALVRCAVAVSGIVVAVASIAATR